MKAPGCVIRSFLMVVKAYAGKRPGGLGGHRWHSAPHSFLRWWRPILSADPSRCSPQPVRLVVAGAVLMANLHAYDCGEAHARITSIRAIPCSSRHRTCPILRRRIPFRMAKPWKISPFNKKQPPVVQAVLRRSCSIQARPLDTGPLSRDGEERKHSETEWDEGCPGLLHGQPSAPLPSPVYNPVLLFFLSSLSFDLFQCPMSFSFSRATCNV